MTTLEAQHEVITNLILENQKIKQERDEAIKKYEEMSKTFYEVSEKEWEEQNKDLLTLAEHGENEMQKLLNELAETRNKMADALQEVDLRTLDFERMKRERDKLLIELEEYRSIADFRSNVAKTFKHKQSNSKYYKPLK